MYAYGKVEEPGRVKFEQCGVEVCDVVEAYLLELSAIIEFNASPEPRLLIAVVGDDAIGQRSAGVGHVLAPGLCEHALDHLEHEALLRSLVHLPIRWIAWAGVMIGMPL